MAITLLMMAAVVNLFANISTGVRDRRAMIDLSGQLRHAQQRLMRDLQGATCDGRTWQRPEENQGYIEIVEGRWSDAEPSALLNGVPADGELNYQTSLVPGSQRTLVEGGFDVDGDGTPDVTDGLALGDYDDILALTVRSLGEPFVGRGPGGGRIESHEAEIIWYAVENPADESLGEPGMRRIYRRVLLIAPWLKQRYWDGSNNFAYGVNERIDARAAVVSANDFFREYDISSHIDPETGLWTPNTLGDLTKRENRFAHLPSVWTRDANGRLVVNTHNYPHRLDVSAIRLDPQLLTNGVVNRFPTGSNSPLHPLGLPFEFDPDDTFTRNDPQSVPTHPPLALGSSNSNKILLDRAGEDLVLDNALAFDVRVFDPEAPLFSVDNEAAMLQPGDIGLRDPANVANGVMQLPPNSISQPVGYGAYVDLAWNVDANVNSYVRMPPNPTLIPLTYPAAGVPLANLAMNAQLTDALLNSTQSSKSIFGRRPATRSWLDLMGPQDVLSGNRIPYRSAVYDTWSFHYENDGIDTDGRLWPNQPPPPPQELVDEGTNGLDDDGFQGVDDPRERETSPPYDTPLRGIQVRLRVYETDARQVRESSATHSF